MSSSFEKARAAQESGNLEEAERIHKATLAETPHHAETLYNLGVLYAQKNLVEEAIRSLTKAIEARPDYAEAWFELSEYAARLGHNDLSHFAGQHSVRLLPNNPRAWLRYGLALSRLERDEDAIKSYRKALDLDPSLVKALVNICVSYKNLSQFEEAEKAILKALDVAGVQGVLKEPWLQKEENYTYLHWHLALLELQKGRYREGFAHFRARFHGGTNWRRYDDPRPLWRGSHLKDKKILVTLEQGYGDVLMFCRYVPLLKEKGAYVLFQTQSALTSFFEGWSGCDEVIDYEISSQTAFDYHVALFDLPFLFETDINTIPHQIPYLPIPAADEKAKIEGSPKLRVGLVSAGEARNVRDKKRSIPLYYFTELLSLQNIEFFSLTRSLREGDAAILKNYSVTDLAPKIENFRDAAKFINQLDLIITCDTALAHLAGGMGKNVWTLLPFVPDWRWMTEREDTPWYPSMRLFRQKEKGDWRDVLSRVKIALNEKNPLS